LIATANTSANSKDIAQSEERSIVCPIPDRIRDALHDFSRSPNQIANRRRRRCRRKEKRRDPDDHGNEDEFSYHELEECFCLLSPPKKKVPQYEFRNILAEIEIYIAIDTSFLSDQKTRTKSNNGIFHTP